MTDMPAGLQIKLKQSLVLHEGRRSKLYTDTVGKVTGGIGYNFTDRGVPDWFIDKQYEEDVNYYYNQMLHDFSWFKDLNQDRQIVLIDMAFMGYKKFCEFKDMINSLAIHDYKGASHAMLESEWAQQVKSRADALAYGMYCGTYTI